MKYIFIWPYGGRRVYLVNSFNGWEKFIEMKFDHQLNTYTLCIDFPLGIHFYKFIVNNGQTMDWCYDILKPSREDGYGGRNNYIEIISVSPQIDKVREPRRKRKISQSKYNGQEPVKLMRTLQNL